MLFKQLLHRSPEQDQQRDSLITSDAASTSKSSTGAACNSDTSTPPNITTNTDQNHGHGQRSTTAALTTKLDLNKPLPPLPTTRPDTESSEVDSHEDDDKSSKTSKAASALSSPSYASSTTLPSNDNHHQYQHQHDTADARIAVILEKLTDGDREIIIRALNSVRMHPRDSIIAPSSNKRKFVALEVRCSLSLSPSPMIDKGEKEEKTKTKTKWRRLARWPWKSCGDGGKGTKGRTSSARDAASSASSPSSRCPSSPATMATSHGEGEGEGKGEAALTRSSLPTGVSVTAARPLRNAAHGKGERSRQTQRDALDEQALRLMYAQTKRQAQTLGTKALKTRERSSRTMGLGFGMGRDMVSPLTLEPVL